MAVEALDGGASVGVAELVRDDVRAESALDRLRRAGVAQLVTLQALALSLNPPFVSPDEESAAEEAGWGQLRASLG